MNELLALPAEALAAAVRGGELSAREVAEASLGRIAEVEPRLGAFLGVEAEAALQAAAAIDERRRRGQRLGRPAGGPVGRQDNPGPAARPTGCASPL